MKTNDVKNYDASLAPLTRHVGLHDHCRSVPWGRVVHRASPPREVVKGGSATMHNLGTPQFGFERLDVWRVSMEALREIKALQIGKFGDLKQQLNAPP